MKSFDEVVAIAKSEPYREYAETFSDPVSRWETGVEQGVAVMLQVARKEIDRLNKACYQRASHEYKLIGELSALRTQAIADAADIEQLRAEVERLKAQRDALLAALGWYGEHSRLARLITSEGDAGRNAIASDGGQKAREAIANARGESV